MSATGRRLEVLATLQALPGVSAPQLAGRVDRRLDVQPYRLVQSNDRWYLVGCVRGGSQWSLYATDRVDRVEPLGTQLPTPEPPDDAYRFALTFLSHGPWRHHVRVRFHTSADVLRERVNPATATIEDDGTSCVLTMTTDDLDWAARFVTFLNVDCA